MIEYRQDTGLGVLSMDRKTCPCKKNAVQDMWGATANVKNIKHGALV